MNIYKLQYDNKAQADDDFLDKGVVQVVEVEGEQEIVYTSGTQALVNLGKIIEIEGTYGPDGNEITPPVYYDGVFYDIMTTDLIDFGIHALTPTNCVHGFAGWATNANGNDVHPE
jgi:hypothetical protein